MTPMPALRPLPAYLDVPFVALAHRGGFSEASPAKFENSLRSFVAAWQMGYRYLETDVHVTMDGVLVAFHDDVLDRATDAQGRIDRLTWAEVSRARIGGVEPIPRFDELLDALPGARFNVDIKAPAAGSRLAETLGRHAAEDRVCIGSFGGARLRQFRRATGGRITTGVSPLGVAVHTLLPGLRNFVALTGQVFQIPERDPRTHMRLVTRRTIQAAHRRGARVHVWTINDRTDMMRLIDLGVDGLITDDISALKDILIARNLWEGNE